MGKNAEVRRPNHYITKPPLNTSVQFQVSDSKAPQLPVNPCL